MEPAQTWNKIPSFNSTGLSDDALWRQLLSSGTGETPAIHAGHCFQEHQWVHINNSGVATTIEIDRHYLVRALRIRYRDLAAIDPTLPLPAPSVILVRARAIAINLDVGGAIRIIICENQVYVLSVPKASDPAVTALPTEDHPFIKRLCSCLKNVPPSSSSSKFLQLKNTPPTTNNNNNSLNQTGSIHTNNKNQMIDFDIPYELRALEVTLAAALGILTAEIDSLEEWGYPAVDALLRQVDRESLELVRKLKNGIDKLQAKVNRIVTEIGDLMRDDDDMLDLYLARRAEAQGLLPLPQPGEDRDHIDDEIEYGGGGDDNDGGFDDGFEEEAREKEAEEAFEDRQRANRRVGNTVRDRNQCRDQPRNRASNNNSQNHSQRNRRFREEIELVEQQHLEHQRQREREPGGRQQPRGQRLKTSTAAATTDERDIIDDDLESIEQSLYSTDLEDEALSQAEEAFLLCQGSLGGGGGDGGSSLYGGACPMCNRSPSTHRVDPHEIEEAEDLLETMFERADMLLRRLSLIDERCEDTEALLDLDLDQKRNQLVGLNVVISSISMAFGFSAAIGGIFGMNLKNENLVEDGWVLVLVLVMMLIGSVSLLVVVAWYMKHKKLMFIPTTV